MKFEKFKTKDFVITGITTAFYIVLYVLFSVVVTTLLPVVGHLFVTGIMSFLTGGIVVLFLIYKVPKFGVITLFSTIFMTLLGLLGMIYLPWIISVIVASLIMDILCNTSNYQNKWKNIIGFGILQIGHILGGIIPVWIAVDSYREAMLKDGHNLEFVQSNIEIYTGYLGVLLLGFTFISASAGMYLGYMILSKHFKN